MTSPPHHRLSMTPTPLNDPKIRLNNPLALSCLLAVAAPDESLSDAHARTWTSACGSPACTGDRAITCNRAFCVCAVLAIPDTTASGPIWTPRRTTLKEQ